MIFIFTTFGVILISILGLLSYLDLKEHNLDIVTLWNKVYTVMSIVTFIYFGIAILFLGYFEKCITFPVIDISNVISRYSSDNYKSSNKKLQNVAVNIMKITARFQKCQMQLTI